MAFHFNMQKVLEYREQLEEDARVRLAKVEQEFAKANDRLDALIAELAEAENKASQPMQSSEYWLHDHYIKGLHADIRAADLQVRMLKQMVQEARNLLTARSIDKKMLDKLRERKKIQYIHAEQKQEQNFNDEIATIRYKAPAVQAGALSGSAGMYQASHNGHSSS